MTGAEKVQGPTLRCPLLRKEGWHEQEKKQTNSVLHSYRNPDRMRLMVSQAEQDETPEKRNDKRRADKTTCTVLADRATDLVVLVKHDFGNGVC